MDCMPRRQVNELAFYHILIFIYWVIDFCFYLHHIMVHKMHGNLLIVDKDRRHFLSFVLYSELSNVANYPSSFFAFCFYKTPCYNLAVRNHCKRFSEWTVQMNQTRRLMSDLLFSFDRLHQKSNSANLPSAYLLKYYQRKILLSGRFISILS